MNANYDSHIWNVNDNRALHSLIMKAIFHAINQKFQNFAIDAI